MKRSWINLLLLFLPVALAAALLGWPPAVVFVVSGLAIVPLAAWLGKATEELAARSGASLGALLNATFGNATELIIALVAVRAGLNEVVKASLAGSIIGNILFVLGLAFVVGGARRDYQRFNRTAASGAASAMLLAVLGLLLPTAFGLTLPRPSSRAVEAFSIFVAGMLVLGYLLHLLFSLRTHAYLYAVDAAAQSGALWSARRALLALALATAGIALMSETLVSSVQGVTRDLGWSASFIGVILVPIIGNAAEHTSAVSVAAKDRMDLSLGIALGSSMQIALLVAPLLVLLSIPLGHPMNLLFAPLELIALIAAVTIVTFVTSDGESNWFEGALLLIAYGILSGAFFLHG